MRITAHLPRHRPARLVAAIVLSTAAIATLFAIALLSGVGTSTVAKGVTFVASIGLAVKSATRVGDLYADTLSRSFWPGRAEPE